MSDFCNSTNRCLDRFWLCAFNNLISSSESSLGYFELLILTLLKAPGITSINSDVKESSDFILLLIVTLDS